MWKDVDDRAGSVGAVRTAARRMIRPAAVLFRMSKVQIGQLRSERRRLVEILIQIKLPRAGGIVYDRVGPATA
jgi:hypothetical protein